jgi:hypothetical protein
MRISVNIVVIGRMHGNLAWRQLEYQPAATDFDMRNFQDVSKKSPVCARIGAIDDRMCPGNHACPPESERTTNVS